MKKSIWMIVLLAGLVAVPALGLDDVNRKDPVDFRKLMVFLGDIEGWEPVAEARGQNIRVGEFHASEAEREYCSGDRKLKITITDAAHYPMMKQGMEMMMQQGIEIDSSEEYITKVEVDSAVGMMEHEYESGESKLTLILENSILIAVELEPAENKKEVIQLAEQLNISKISTLSL